MHIRSRRAVRGLAAVVTALAATVLLAPSPAYAAEPRPYFQMPFPCWQGWVATTYADHGDQDNIDLTRWAVRSGVTTNISSGQAVLASAAGRVSRVRTWDGTPNPSEGNVIDIDHGNGWTTTYAHLLHPPSVIVGQLLGAGQMIGWVGSTGTGAAHLHYAQIENGTPKRARFNGSDINTHADNPASWNTWPSGEQLTSRNCGGKQLIAEHSNQCVTAPFSDLAGGVVQQWPCNAGDRRQMWTLVPLGRGQLRIVSMRSGMCLDVANGGLFHANSVVVMDCNGASTQSWQQTGWGPSWSFRVTSDLVLDVAWASQAGGERLVIGNWWDGANQRFRINHADNP